MDQTPALNLTESAARHISAVAAKEKNAALMLRLMVRGGGCSGFEYVFTFDTRHDPADDLLVERDGARLVVDKTSLGLLKGSEIDFRETMLESGFRVQNPKATSSCGCGASFAVEE